jgi:hypothetical protein
VRDGAGREGIAGREKRTVKKKVPVVNVGELEAAAHLAGWPLEGTVALGDLAAAVRGHLLGSCPDVGRMVMRQMMDHELAQRIGSEHVKLVDRAANWHSITTGSVVLGGRLAHVEGPRGGTTDGQEVRLESWAVFRSRDLLE